MIFPALFLVLAFAFLLNSIVGFKNKPAYIIGIYLLSFANIVFVSQIASLLKQINQTFFLLAHFGLVLVAFIFWNKFGKPSLLGPFEKQHLYFWQYLPSIRQNADLYILGFFVGVVYVIGAVLILTLPQNNFDSMTYHLSRVGYWLQHRTLFPWPTPNPRQTTFPINAELGVMWTILFWGSDQMSGFVQWVSSLVLMITILGFSRLLGASLRQGIFAALIWAGLPQIILQSVTTMNDLVASAFLATAIYLFLIGLRLNRNKYLLLSGLGIGLAIGTKSTVIIALPGLFLVLVATLWIIGRRAITNILIWGAASVAGFLLVGAFGYIQNMIVYQNPFSVSQWTSVIVSPKVSRIELLFENSLLYLIQMLDFVTLPHSINESLSRLEVKVIEKLISGFKIFNHQRLSDWRQYLNFILYSPLGIHEDTIWFGPLAFLVVLPASLYHMVIGVRRKEITSLTLILLATGFGLTLATMIGWSPYRGRYFTIAATLFAPFVFIVFGMQWWQKTARWVITFLSILIMIQTTLFNRSKPLVGPDSVWSIDDIKVRTQNNRGMESILRMVDELVPPSARLATKLGGNAWDYPLFGENFQRTIIQVDPFQTEVDTAWLSEQSVDFLLVEPKEGILMKVPDGLSLIEDVNGWALYEYCSPEDCENNFDEHDPFFGASDSKNFFSIAPSLIGKVGITALQTGAWDIEQNGNKGVYWLGEGRYQSLTGYLWSEDERDISIVIEMVPGPSKSKPQRTIEFSFSRIRGYEYLQLGHVNETHSFEGPITIEFEVRLHHGLNVFHLMSTDFSDIRELPNGDRRPLLVLVKDIVIQE